METVSKNICPCGISPEAWMFCSAGICDVCINSREFIDSLKTVSHTDRHIPCPTCGFHVVTYENDYIYIGEDE